MKKVLLLVYLLTFIPSIAAMEAADPSNKPNLNQQFFDVIEEQVFVKHALELIEQIVNVKDKNGQSPLIWAAYKGQLELCTFLIDKGAIVNTTSKSGYTPLINAAINGNSDICRLLIENGANIHAKDKKAWSPLYWAAHLGHSEACKILIENGAQVNAKTNGGWTPLKAAARYGHSEACKILIKNGGDVNAKDKQGWSPLKAAARYGHSEICKLLIENGADVNAKDNKGFRPLYRAAQFGHSEICKILIENGAQVNAKTNGWTPLKAAARYGHSETCKVLIENGADVNAKDKKGDTALARAIFNGHLDICVLLLENGAYLNAKDRYGDTPLSWALKGGNVELCRLLLSHAILLPKTDGLKTSQERIKAALLSFRRKTHFSKDVQYLILRSDKELKKDLIKVLSADLKRGNTPPVKLRNFVAEAIADTTIKELKSLTKATLKKNLTYEIRSLLDPELLEAHFKKPIEDTICNRFANRIPIKDNAQPHKKNVIQARPKKSSSWLNTKSCIIAAAIGCIGYYCLHTSNKQEDANVKPEINVKS